MHKPIKELERHRDMLAALRDRKAEEIKDLEKQNVRLRERLSKEQALREDENEKNVVYLSDQQRKVVAMRFKLRQMKDKMLELDKNTINIARNPSKAIQKVSQPILDKLNDDLEDNLQPHLEQNMLKKSDLESQLGSTHSEILDESIKQIHLRQQLVEQKQLAEDMIQDTKDLRQRIEVMQQRRGKLLGIVEEQTDYWVEKAAELKKQVDEAVDWYLKNKELRDRFRSETEMLTRDRDLTSYRYEASISDLIDRTRVLQSKWNEIYDFLWNFDRHMAAQFIGLTDLQDVIAVGRFAEIGKRNTLFLDLEKKGKFISEIITQKEEYEVEMAPRGVFNHIFVTLNDI